MATDERSRASHLMISVMRTAGLALACVLVLAGAENLKLYLKDGSDHMVREYQVMGDRVRFYSLERSAWEEIPLEFVDLEKTKQEQNRLAEENRARAEEDRVERQAEREGRTELQRVPLDDGLYWVNGDQILPAAQGETKVVGQSKRRAVLKVIAPLPIVTGKQTVELAGTQSKFVVRASDGKPQFYFRLSTPERFGLVRMKLKKDSRIVQEITVIPVSKEIVEEQQEIEVFRQQLAPAVFKIWPVEPLEPGEYGIIQFIPGKANLRVWDFSYRK